MSKLLSQIIRPVVSGQASLSSAVIQETDQRLLMEKGENEQDSLSHYFSEIAGYAILSREREYALGENTAEGRRLVLNGLCGDPEAFRTIFGWYKHTVSENGKSFKYTETACLPLDIYKKGKQADMGKARKARDKKIIEKCKELIPLLNEFEEVQAEFAKNSANGVLPSQETTAAYDEAKKKLIDSLVLVRPRDKCLVKLAAKRRTYRALCSLQIEEIEKGLRLMEDSKRQLFLHNTRLVVSVAKKFLGRGLTISDLIQEGNLGLMKAVDKFDHTRGLKFSTAAFPRIIASIKLALREQTKDIRVPPKVQNNINRLRTAAQEFRTVNDKNATIDELAEITKLNKSAVETAQCAAPLGYSRSLDAPVSADSDASFVDFVSADGPSQQNIAEDAELSRIIRSSLETLKPKEKDILTKLLEGATTEDVQTKFGFTRREILAKHIKSAYQKLRENPELKALRDEMFSSRAGKKNNGQGANRKHLSLRTKLPEKRQEAVRPKPEKTTRMPVFSGGAVNP